VKTLDPYPIYMHDKHEKQCMFKTVKRAKIKLENTNNITIKTQYNKHF
jgi:hypothetical protein